MCRGTLFPDPRYDAVRCVALATCDDSEEVPDGQYTTRVLIFDPEGCAGGSRRPLDGLDGLQVCTASGAVGYLNQSPWKPNTTWWVSSALQPC